MTLDADKLTDKQLLLVIRAFPVPTILKGRGEKITAANLVRNGWGDVEKWSSGEVLFRLNQDGEDAYVSDRECFE